VKRRLRALRRGRKYNQEKFLKEAELKKLNWVLIFMLAILAVNLDGMVAAESAGERGIGEKLVRQLYEDVKTGNVEALKKMMAPGFQSAHRDGARDRKEELQLIQGLNLGKYTLTNLKVTQNGPVITVTYFVSVEETIKGKRLSATKPAARLSAWLKTDSGWKWIIHANLRKLTRGGSYEKDSNPDHDLGYGSLTLCRSLRRGQGC
jgi:hypothetical protein